MAETISWSIRLKPSEKDALFKLAEQRGVPASELLRRLIREAVFHGPSFFDDQLGEASKLRFELVKMSWDLNKIAKGVNYGTCKANPIELKLMTTLYINVKKTADLMKTVIEASIERRAILRRATLYKRDTDQDILFSDSMLKGAAPPGQSSQ